MSHCWGWGRALDAVSPPPPCCWRPLTAPSLCQSLVHVSTAYSNADKREVREMVYAPPADPEAVIKLVKSLPEEAMPGLASALMGKKHPNTYTLTKAMAEWIVQEEVDDIPCAIVRPSIGEYPAGGYCRHVYRV